MTKEQIESMIIGSNTVIVCQNGQEKLEAYNLIAQNLDIPLGDVAADMVERQEILFEDHLELGYIDLVENGYMTGWKSGSPMIKNRGRIMFSDFHELVEGMGENAVGEQDTSIEEDFMRLFA